MTAFAWFAWSRKKDARVVGTAKVSMGGKVSQQASFSAGEGREAGNRRMDQVDPDAESCRRVNMRWLKCLSPQEMNLYVWDFGVNPNAPANPNTWQPAPAS